MNTSPLPAVRGGAAADNGMSLVELIVSIAVSALLLGLIATIFSQGLKSQQEQTSRDFGTAQLNAASALLNESLRNSSAALVSDDGQRIDVQYLAGSLSDDAPYSCRSLQISEGNLWYREAGGPTGTLSSDTWSVLMSNLADSASGEPSGFSAEGPQSFSYFLNVSDGDTEISTRDGGYPGVVNAEGGNSCW